MPLPHTPPSHESALARLQRITAASRDAATLRERARTYAELRGQFRYA